MNSPQNVCILPTFGPMGAPSPDMVFGFPEVREFERDTILTHQGQAPARVFWIESGVVKKVCLQQDGTEVITGLRTAGWIVGAAAILLRSPQQSTAITATKCMLRAMSLEAFRVHYTDCRGLARHVNNMLAMELAVRLRANSSVRHSTTRSRLEHFLAECAEVAETLPPGIDPLRLRQTEIAQIVGSTPEHLSRLLHQMELEGVLDRHRPPFV
jgi:CRP-like cAMP-binding protein